MKEKTKCRIVGWALLGSAVTAIYFGGLPVVVGIIVGLVNGAYLAGMAVAYYERRVM